LSLNGAFTIASISTASSPRIPVKKLYVLTSCIVSLILVSVTGIILNEHLLKPQHFTALEAGSKSDFSMELTYNSCYKK
jgi:hypothetical protein